MLLPMRNGLALMVLLSACGPKESTTPKDSEAPELRGESQTVDKLEVRKEAACDKSMGRLAQCAAESAQANLPPEKLQELTQQAPLEAYVEAYTKKLTGECYQHELSERQVGIYEACDPALPCEDYVACLQKADKGRKETAADIRRGH